MRTLRDTTVAIDANFRAEKNLRFKGLGFRIVAPLAAEGAAFQENSCSNAWTILNTEMLNIEN